MNNPFDDHQAIAEELKSIGWKATGDAQWTGLKLWCEDKSRDFRIAQLNAEIETRNGVIAILKEDYLSKALNNGVGHG